MNAKAQKSAPAIVVEDAKLAAQRHVSERAQIIGAIETAEDLRSNALLFALKMTITLGATSKDEVAKYWPSCNNPGVYASWFNVGAKAQTVVGEKLAIELIDKAAAVKGQQFQNARDALQAVIREAKAQGVKELKPAAAKLAVKSAIVSVGVKKEKAEIVKRGTKAQDAATLAAAAVEAGKGHREMAHFLKLCSNNAHRFAAPQGREDAHREAVQKLADACEAWSIFR